MKKTKPKDNRVLVTIELESDLYFQLLQFCVDKRMSLDEAVELALKDFVEKNKHLLKKTKKKGA